MIDLAGARYRARPIVSGNGGYTQRMEYLLKIITNTVL